MAQAPTTKHKSQDEAEKENYKLLTKRTELRKMYIRIIIQISGLHLHLHRSFTWVIPLCQATLRSNQLAVLYPPSPALHITCTPTLTPNFSSSHLLKTPYLLALGIRAPRLQHQNFSGVHTHASTDHRGVGVLRLLLGLALL